MLSCHARSFKSLNQNLDRTQNAKVKPYSPCTDIVPSVSKPRIHGSANNGESLASLDDRSRINQS